jgi:hypothetical protein
MESLPWTAMCRSYRPESEPHPQTNSNCAIGIMYLNRSFLSTKALMFFFVFLFVSCKKEFPCANLENYSIEPAIAYYVKDHAYTLSGIKDTTRVRMIVWPDGKIIWSSFVYDEDDHSSFLSATIQYYESTISKNQLSEFLAEIQSLRPEQYDQIFLISFDIPWCYIYMKQPNGKSIKMGNSFEDFVFEIYEDSTEEELKSIEFRKTWDEVRAIIEKMIPENGQEINPVFVYPPGD